MVFQHVQLLFAVGSGRTRRSARSFCSSAPPQPPPCSWSRWAFCSAASRTGVRSGVVRGLQLFALGYALNLVRFGLPLLLKATRTPSRSSAARVGSFFEIDILQLGGPLADRPRAGQAVVRDPRLVWRWRRRSWPPVAPLLWGVGGGSARPRPAVGVGERVSFPLFPGSPTRFSDWPWPGSPRGRPPPPGSCARGRWPERRRCLSGARWLVPAGAGVLAFGDYYRSGLSVQLLLAGFVLLWLPRCGGWTAASPGARCRATSPP